METQAQASRVDAEPTSALRSIFERQRVAFMREGPPDYNHRLAALKKLRRIVEQHETGIADAISADFGHRSRFETSLTEVVTVLADITHAERHLKRWMKPKRVPTALEFRPGRNEVRPQPLGVVGIISPWNYPLYLSFSPAVSALAAGNRIVLKPSEITPKTSALLQRLIGSEFKEDEFAVVTGGVDKGREMAATPFDHLLFTGSTEVGREVAIAAARNLTPVTLELGGKSPAIIADDFSIAAAAERIAVGKLMNAGQTCIAPDYVLLPERKLEEFIAATRAAVARLYSTFEHNDDYASMATDRHYARQLDLLREAEARGSRVINLASPDEKFNGARKLAPVMVINPHGESRALREEIFGPVVPVKTYTSLNEAVEWVNRGPRPLALYWFGNDRQQREYVLSRTHSGGVTVNDTIWHICQHSLPFGGVGASGSGAYHGEHGFRTFSHYKGVFYSGRFSALPWLRPPYGTRARRVLSLLRRLFYR